VDAEAGEAGHELVGHDRHNYGSVTIEGEPVSRNLLVIDDDPASCRLVKAIFKPEGIEVSAAHDGPAGLAHAERHRPDLVLLDLHLPRLGGLDVLQRLHAAAPTLPVVMLTAHHDVKTAVRATQLGAFAYLTKPVNDEELVVVVKRALKTAALEQEVAELRRKTDEGSWLAELMGASPEIQQVIDQVKIVAASGFTVLVLGETGAGKELVAQAIHRQSERRTRSFSAIDCGAIPEQLLESELFGHEKGAFTGADRRREGRFQLAEGGTFFLDEVGNLPLHLQAKLLRVLESRQVQAVGASGSAPMNVRFVAAANQDLQARVASGDFRADLYFRLAQYTIALPALRQRTADIAFLARRFLDEASIELRRPLAQIGTEAIELLAAYPWPGNVRELRNVIRQAVLQADGVVRPQALRALLGRGEDRPAVQKPSLPAGLPLREIAARAAEAAERHAICETLRATQGNKSQAAKALQTDYKTLHVKLKRLGIRARDFAS
jgi:two-component system response regulator HydG